MTSQGSSHRLPLWALSIVVPVLALILSVALSLVIRSPLLLVPFPLALMVGPGILAGLRPASLRSSLRWAVVGAGGAFLTTGALYVSVVSDVFVGFSFTAFVLLFLPAGLVVGATVLIAVGRSVGTGIAYWRTARSRALLPFVPIAVSAALIMVLTVLYADNRAELAQRISDAGMMDNFQQHKPAFEQMRQMSDEDFTDSTIRTLYGPDHVGERCSQYGLPPTARFGSASCSRFGLTEERCSQYQGLFAETGVQNEIWRAGSCTYFEYHMSDSGIVAVSKGYVYSPTPPGPIADSIDGPAERPQETVYKRIAEGWYLYRMTFDWYW